MRDGRFKAAAILAVAHLALVAWHATGQPIPGRRSWPNRAVGVYAMLSGADNRYGFFAPSVSASVRAVIVAAADGERTKETELKFTDSVEANLRLGTEIDLFPRVDPSLRRLIAASWAASALGSDPTLPSVLVRVEYHDLPTMREYRAGRRPSWVRLYEGRFKLLDPQVQR